MDRTPERSEVKSPHSLEAAIILELFARLRTEYLDETTNGSPEHLALLAGGLELADLTRRRAELLAEISKGDVVDKLCWTSVLAHRLQKFPKKELTAEDSVSLEEAMQRLQDIYTLPNFTAVDDAMNNLQQAVNCLMGRGSTTVE